MTTLESDVKDVGSDKEHLGIAIFICLIPSLDVSFLIATYIGTITGIMMITVSQYVQIMLGDNPDNPEVIFSNKLTDPW